MAIRCKRKAPEAEPSNKKQKNVGSNAPSLPPEIFSLVFPFLAPRQILRLALTSSALQIYVNHELVVRNTVMLGGVHARGNLKSILDGLCKQTIYTPSPLRLLRIVNGKRCERCLQKTNNLRLGLFVCATCANDLTTHRSYRERPCEEIEMLIRDDCVDKTWETMILKKPFTTSGGNRIGPFVTYSDMKRMIDEGITLDDFFGNVQVPDQNMAQKLQQVYHDAGVDKQIICTEDCNRREDKEKSKVRKIIDAIDQVKALLKGPTNVMDYTVSADGTYCSLSFGITHDLMKEIISAPSKITKKKLREIAASVDAAYPLAMKHGLHDFTCLSVDDPLQAVIRQHIQDRFVPGMEFLRDRTFSGAVASIKVEGDAMSPVLKRAFNWTYGSVPTELRNLIAEVIVGHRESDLDLAKSICAGINRVTISTSSEWLLCQRLYKFALREYTLLQPAVAAYLNNSEIQLFLETGNMDDVWMEAKYSLLSMMVYSPRDYDKVRLWLMGHDWAALRGYHASNIWFAYRDIIGTLDF